MGRSDIWAILTVQRNAMMTFLFADSNVNRATICGLSARAGKVCVALSATSPQTQHGKEGRYQQPYELPW